MFGKRSSKKSERLWRLDTRARAHPLRSLRLRLAAGALGIAAGLVLGLAGVWKGGELALEKFVYQNPRFAIARIFIETDGIIPHDRIQAWAGVQPGQNLLALDLGRINRDLELVPLIRFARVERVLPQHLIIRVREREPVARVTVFTVNPANGLLDPAAVYLDEQGMVIPPVLRALNASAFDTATRGLPVITGAGDATFRPGRIVESPRILSALAWMREFKASPMAGRAGIRSVDASSDAALLVTTDQGAEVSFSHYSIAAQLARWRGVQELALRRERFVASLDLAVTNYVPAVWLEATNAPPPAPRQETPSPYRRKNV